MLFINNTNVVELDELMDFLNEIYLTGSASVMLTVQLDGVDVPGEAWPLAMTYVGANGKFHGKIKSTLNFVNGVEYDVIVDVVDVDSGLNGQWSEKSTARLRGDH